MSELPIIKGQTHKSCWLSTKDPKSNKKWEDINMYFVVGLPHPQKSYDSIWVVVDRLTKSARFIPVKSSYSAEDYDRIFLDEIL